VDFIYIAWLQIAMFNTLHVLCKVYDLKDSDPNGRLQLISFFFKKKGHLTQPSLEAIGGARY
jgi:hypothetical protein